MKPTYIQCLQLASHLIASADISKYRTMHLCAFNGTIAVRPSNHCETFHDTFFTLGPKHFSKGLLSDEWDTVAHRLAEYLSNYPNLDPVPVLLRKEYFNVD